MNSEDFNQVVKALQACQSRNGWSDRRMAKELGVSPSQWHRVQSGERRVNVQILRAAVQSFGISGKVLSFLESQLPVPNQRDTTQQQELAR